MRDRKSLLYSCSKSVCAHAHEPVKDKADNWNIAMYLNGKKIYDKAVADFTPDSGKGAVELGKGWGGPWVFTGELTSVFVEQKALSAEEISKLMKTSPAGK